jgi:hypothetical protein
MRPAEVEPPPSVYEEDDIEEIGRPEGPLDERHIDPFGIGDPAAPVPERDALGSADEPWREAEPAPSWEPADVREAEPGMDHSDDEPEAEPAVEPWVAPRSEDPAQEDDAPTPDAARVEVWPAAEARYGRRRARRR